MGNEGQKSPRDVASEDKKHPWEILSESETSAAEKSEKKRTKLEKKKANREKRKAKLNSFKAWVKKNPILFFGSIVLVITVIVTIVILIGIFTAKNKPDDANKDLSPIEVTDITADVDSILSAKTPDLAFSYAYKNMKKNAADGIFVEGTVGIDRNKLEDNLDEFMKSVESDYDKIAYSLIKIMILDDFDENDRAEYFLTLFDEKNYDLDKNLRYIYILVVRYHYLKTEDTDKYKEWTDTLFKEYNPDEMYIDSDSGEIVENPNSDTEKSEDEE